MKGFYNTLLSVFLILLTVFMFKNYVDIETNNDLEKRISFKIEQDDNTETVKLWQNEEGKCFVFLPSYAKLENTHISLKKPAHLDGTLLTDGQTLNNIELSKIYILSFDKSNEKYPIQFLKSANVASMYVNTQTGSMERIYADKSNKEKASIALYTSEGKLDYSGRNDGIKCRGNSTFYKEKKPFLLNLDKPDDLLGMGSARKWVLLANALDLTNLRNKLVLDFARKTSLKWTPDCEYVDLYLNGEYNGLYLLCEKVEVGGNRLNINTSNGFLFTLNSRLENNKHFFKTNGNRTIEIVYPTNCSAQKLNKLKGRIDCVELQIMNQLQESHNLFDNIDLSTWATRYLIDELFLNIDGDWASSYFYCDNIEGKIYAGPAWDYDLCLNYIGPLQRDTMLRGYKKWYHKLNENVVFLNEVKQLYQSKYKSQFKEIEEKELDAIIESIHSAVEENNLRWGIDDSAYRQKVEDIRDVISERIKFLEEYWFGGGKYYDITVLEMYHDKVYDDNEHVYVYHTIKEGSVLASSAEDLSIDKDIIWLDAKTGEEFDINQPIFEDKIIYPKPEEEVEEDIAIAEMEANCLVQLCLWFVHNKSITILAIFLIILVLFVIIDVKNQKRGAENGK